MKEKRNTCTKGPNDETPFCRLGPFHGHCSMVVCCHLYSTKDTRSGRGTLLKKMLVIKKNETREKKYLMRHRTSTDVGNPSVSV